MEEELRKVLMRQLPVFSALEAGDLLLISRSSPLMEGLIGPEVFQGIPGPPGPPPAAPLESTAPPGSAGERVMVTMQINAAPQTRWFTNVNVPQRDGRPAYRGTTQTYDEIFWDGTVSQWCIFLNDLSGGFFNVADTPVPPSTGWVPDTNGAANGAQLVTYFDLGGLQAEMLGQLCIVRHTNDSGTFEDVWINSNLAPMTWQPPGNIYQDRATGVYYRIFYRDGAADTELAYA